MITGNGRSGFLEETEWEEEECVEEEETPRDLDDDDAIAEEKTRYALVCTKSN